MDRNQFGAYQLPYSFHGSQPREIGLRAVAAAILYHGTGHVDRAGQLPTAATAMTPSSDLER
jgi:hypothetical protein